MRIVSFIGGGVRGAFSARLIERLEEAVPGFVESVDFFAGTSVGSINALCLASGMAPVKVAELFHDLAPRVFASRGWLDSATGLDELVRANYDIDRLSDILKAELGEDTTLGDLRKHVLVPTFCLDNQHEDPAQRNWKPKYLHNFDSPGNDKAWLAWAAGSASSAAPTYFESFLAPDGRRYIDGGMMDNNPSMSALARAVKAGAGLGDVQLLSIGTGFNPHRATGGDWGYKQWLLGTAQDQSGLLLDILFDGMIGVPDYQAAQLLGDRKKDPDGHYLHLDARLGDPIDLADVDRLADLVAAADAVNLDAAVSWLSQVWVGSPA